MELNRMSDWVKILTQVLGKECASCCEDIIILMNCVDQSVKPCFMWDYFSVDSKVLLTLIQALHSKQLISNPLSVVEVDSDVFIVNLNSLTRVLIGYLTSNHSWLIDISKHNAKVAATSVHDAFKQYICSILRQLGVAGRQVSNLSNTDSRNLCKNTKDLSSNEVSGKQTDGQYGAATTSSNSSGSQGATSNLLTETPTLLVLQLPEEANVSTIFGCMLGYPQVYWWDSQSTGSCLSGMALKIYEFSADWSMCETQSEAEKQLTSGVEDDDNGGDSVEIFSFSVPESLETELRPAIQLWGNIANTRVEHSALFSNAKFNCDPVLCLQVAL
uniref:UPF0739 protein C1orf74 homolog n=1 Tax=Hirondellea gigas TaxID=1518452 RepID=A0A2P2I0G1_9CRUS